MRKAALLACFASQLSCTSAWTPGLQRSKPNLSSRGPLASSIVLNALPKNFQDIGTQIIQDAGISCGMKSAEDLEIEWKSGRVIVTVRGSVYVSNPDETEESDEREGEGDDDTSPEAVSGVDITQLARAINFALGEDEVGSAIAEKHEIEVTTPGASGKL